MHSSDALSAVMARSRDILLRCRTIAILGARDNPMQAGFYVPQYLYEHGYTGLPVNPEQVGLPDVLKCSAHRTQTYHSPSPVFDASSHSQRPSPAAPAM